MTEVIEGKVSHPQNPAHILDIDGIDYIVDKNNIPIFYMDGSPVKEDGKWQCIGKSHASGYRCMRYQTTTYSVCQKHGAGSPLQGRPGGRKPTTYKFSSTLKGNYLDRYERSMEDKDLLNLSSAIALFTERQKDIMNLLSEEEESRISFVTLMSGIGKMKTALDDGDMGALEFTVENIIGAATIIDADFALWDQFQKLALNQSKLVKQETERRKAIGSFLLIEEAVAMIEYMIGEINDKVANPEERAALVAGFSQRFGSKDTSS